jgi:hypothetical protein
VRTIKTLHRDGRGRIVSLEERQIPEPADVADVVAGAIIQELGLPNTVPYGGDAKITVSLEKYDIHTPEYIEEIRNLIPQRVRAQWPKVMSDRCKSITIRYDGAPSTTEAVAATRTMPAGSKTESPRKAGFITG